MLLVLAALWGATFLFMKVAAPVLGPVLLIELRVAIAALSLGLYAAVIGRRPRVLHRWKDYIVLGLVNAAIPFLFIAAAELSIDAALASTLNATAPLFTALVARVSSRERLTPKKLAGFALGIVGVGILVGWTPHGVAFVVPAALSLTAALLYAVGGVLTAKRFRGEDPLDLSVGQQLGAAVVLLPAVVFFPPARAPGPDTIFSVLGLAVFSTALAYLIYFRLIRSVGAVKTLSVTYLVPVFGIFWGWLLLHEQVSLSMILGLLLILLSVAFITGSAIRIGGKGRLRPSR